MLLPTLPQRPYAVTDDTFVIPTIAAAPDGTFVSANSLVIRGAEPVIVDTGCALVRDDWAERAFSVVEPEDVRWIVITHDDHDHIGNIDLVLERCPNATLVVNYLIVARLVADVELPIDRMQWKNEGDTAHAPGPHPAVRAPAAVRLAVDRAGVRHVHRRHVGCRLVREPRCPVRCTRSATCRVAMLDEQFPLHNQWNTPWLQWVDTAKFDAHLQGTESLPVAACTRTARSSAASRSPTRSPAPRAHRHADARAPGSGRARAHRRRPRRPAH